MCVCVCVSRCVGRALRCRGAHPSITDPGWAVRLRPTTGQTRRRGRKGAGGTGRADERGGGGAEERSERGRTVYYNLGASLNTQLTANMQIQMVLCALANTRSYCGTRLHYHNLVIYGSFWAQYWMNMNRNKNRRICHESHSLLHPTGYPRTQSRNNTCTTARLLRYKPRHGPRGGPKHHPLVLTAMGR